ncbi:hypothetical protein SH2C18_27290 [Clostridium sediminicola]
MALLKLGWATNSFCAAYEEDITFAEMNEVYASYFENKFPARITVETTKI